MGQTLWFASRACGVVALVLLTGTTALGALHTGRAASAAWPRFVLHGLHRNLALLAVVFVAVHVATAIIDPYAGIRWIDAVVPFASRYHPFWTGLGAGALDLLAALVVTSLVRTRLPLAFWQRLHRTAYGLWPVALAHGLGLGGRDSGLGWVRAIDLACALAVAAALVARLRARHPDTEARRALEPR
jgi:DMSO/TMAO reductase YedYZ heme-binding membrane subunit